MINRERRPGGYKSYTREEMRTNFAALLSVTDYEKADKVILALMQPQVQEMMDSPPVGKKKASNPHKGTRTIPTEFLNRPLAGPDVTRNLASISPFKVDRIYYTQGRFGKELKHIL